MKTPRTQRIKPPKRFAVGTPVRVVMPGIDGIVIQVDEERTVLSQYWHTVQTKFGERREPGSILELIPPPIGIPTPKTGKLADNIHFHGPNARLNVDSIDSSTNTVSISKDRVFVELREQAKSIADPAAQADILARTNEGAAPAADRPRYFLVESMGSGEITELRPSLWEAPCPTPNWRYYGRVFQEMERHLDIPNLRFYITWDIDKLPEYGPHVVVLLLGEEIGRIPHYSRHVCAVIKTMAIKPCLGIRRWIPFDRVRVALVIKHLRNLALYAKSRIKAALGLPRVPALRLHHRPYLLQTPLGVYSVDDLPIKPMKDRPYHAFFAGNVQARTSRTIALFDSPKSFARQNMLNEAIALARRNPEFKFDYRVTDNPSAQSTQDERTYSQRLMDSKICLSPRGSVAETWRFFEGLKYGCLVIAEPLPDRAYYRHAPVIQIDDWSQLEQAIAPFLQDDSALDEWSARAVKYFNERCSEPSVGRSVAEFIRNSPALHHNRE